MDTFRQVRFLIAPFFFYCSLLLGAILSGNITKEIIYCMPVGLVAAVGAILTASLFPLGFFIGAITYFLFDVPFYVWYWIMKKRKPLEGKLRHWELTLLPEAMKKTWSKVDTTENGKEEDRLYAAFTLNHEILPQRLYDFTMRTWTAFTISAHSITALLLAHIVGHSFIKIPWTAKWGYITFYCILILLWNAVRTWRHTMRMLDYQARREPIKTDDKQENEQENERQSE